MFMNHISSQVFFVRRIHMQVASVLSLSVTYYYLGQKNRFSREIHEVNLQFIHVITCDIERRFDIDATRGICASRARVADRS